MLCVLKNNIEMVNSYNANHHAINNFTFSRKLSGLGITLGLLNLKLKRFKPQFALRFQLKYVVNSKKKNKSGNNKRKFEASKTLC